MKIGVVVPTLNAGPLWPDWIESVRTQSSTLEEVVVMDSASDDQTACLARQAGFTVISVERASFDHGGTRQIAVDYLAGKVDVVVFLTQDAELADRHAIEHLASVFQCTELGCAYGRQKARESHSDIAKHHRTYNYPIEPSTADASQFSYHGLRAAFCSNSFAAYRLSALQTVGGFPSGTIFGEDMIAAVKIMRAGYNKRYVPEAVVWHAHDYSKLQEFQRYFDMGVMHTSEPLLVEILASGASSGGMAFVRSEISTVAKGRQMKVLALVARSGIRWLGYQLGKRHTILPRKVRRFCAMNKGYFK